MSEIKDMESDEPTIEVSTTKSKKSKKSSKSIEVVEEVVEEIPAEEELEAVEEVPAEEILQERPAKKLGHTHRKMSRALSEMPLGARKYHRIRSGH